MSGHHILVLGATGVSGLAFIEEALQLSNPPKLTLYVRSTSKLPQGTDLKTRVVVGDLTDQAQLQVAMEGVDTVVSFLGAYVTLSAMFWRTKTTPIADSFQFIFAAMKAKNVERILALSTPGFHVPPETHNWTWAAYLLMPRVMAPQGNAEMHNIGVDVSSQSSLDWTVFRIPLLDDGSADKKVWAGLLGPEHKGTLGLSRRSMARWVLEEIEKREWIQKAPVLGNY